MQAMSIGLRNLARRPSRTALTVGGVFISTALIVFTAGMNEGTYAQMIALATGSFTGQLQVQAPGYEESPSLFETVDEPAPILEALRADPDVVAASPRVEVAGLLSADVRTSGGMLVGVDPQGEQRVSALAGTLVEGSFLGATSDPEAWPIVLGSGLARRLRVKLGDEVTYLGQAADGSIAAEVFELVGLAESGSAELDSAVALVRIDHAQELFVLGDRVHRIAAKLSDPATADAVKRRLDPRMPKGAVLLHWRTLLPGLEPSIESDRAGTTMFLFIILVVVALASANTMLMSVFERTRELGVMMALGTSPGLVVRTVLWEATFQGVAGVLLGVAAGVALNLYFARVGLTLLDEPIEFAGVSFQTMYPANTWRTVVYPLIIFASSVAAGIWPALRAARLDPVTAIRGGGGAA